MSIYEDKHFVIQKGEAECNQGNKKANFKVTNHKKHYINGEGSDDYLAVTEEDVQFTPPIQTFGECRLRPKPSGGFLPCIFAPADKWQRVYQKVKIEDKALITEISQLPCATGGIISVANHGQTQEITKQNLYNASPEVLNEFFPFADLFEETNPFPDTTEEGVPKTNKLQLLNKYDDPQTEFSLFEIARAKVFCSNLNHKNISFILIETTTKYKQEITTAIDNKGIATVDFSLAPILKNLMLNNITNATIEFSITVKIDDEDIDIPESKIKGKASHKTPTYTTNAGRSAVKVGKRNREFLSNEMFGPIQATIQFRPTQNWKGEFGFDWFRLGDTKLFNDNYFKDIVAYQYEEEQVEQKDPITGKTVIDPDTNEPKMTTKKVKVKDGNKYDGEFIPDEEMLEKLKREYTQKDIPWETEENEIGEKIFKTYYIPWLSIQKDQEIELTYFAKNYRNTEYFEFVIPQNEEGQDFFEITPKRIPINNQKTIKLNEGENIKIKCLHEFDTDQMIGIRAYNELEGEGIIKTLAPYVGYINVWANKDMLKEKKVVFVKVKVPNLTGGSRAKEVENIDAEKDRINQYLGQAYIKLSDDSEIIELDLTTTVTENNEELDLGNYFTENFATNRKVDRSKKASSSVFIDFLKERLEKQTNKDYNNYFKAFYFAEKGHHPTPGAILNGFSRPLADFTVAFGTANDQTAAHEFLHAFNLPHTFTNKEASAHASFTYTAKTTDNIMDYSHQVSGGRNERKSLYYWQWRKANDSLND